MERGGSGWGGVGHARTCGSCSGRVGLDGVRWDVPCRSVVWHGGS